MSNISREAMRNIDIMTVDPSTLVDIETVEINENIPRTERIIDFIKKMNGNPYLYKQGERVIKISFSGTDLTFDEIYEDMLRTTKK